MSRPRPTSCPAACLCVFPRTCVNHGSAFETTARVPAVRTALLAARASSRDWGGRRVVVFETFWTRGLTLAGEGNSSTPVWNPWNSVRGAVGARCGARREPGGVSIRVDGVRVPGMGLVLHSCGLRRGGWSPCQAWNVRNPPGKRPESRQPAQHSRCEKTNPPVK